MPSLSDLQIGVLSEEIRNDPDGRGYLAFKTDDPAMNIFNVLRDPSWLRPDGEAKPVQGLLALGIVEGDMTPDDVRACLEKAKE